MKCFRNVFWWISQIKLKIKLTTQLTWKPKEINSWTFELDDAFCMFTPVRQCCGAKNIEFQLQLRLHFFYKILNIPDTNVTTTWIFTNCSSCICKRMSNKQKKKYLKIKWWALSQAWRGSDEHLVWLSAALVSTESGWALSW